MRATVVIAFVFALVVSLVGATPHGLNARRMAQGLGPLPPVRRSPTKAAVAARQEPSGAPSQCQAADIQCCNSTHSSHEGIISTLFGILNIHLDGPAQTVGVNCSPVSALGLGGNSCTSQTVCCSDNSFNGLVAIGCTPINLGL